jgi:Tol biopolymer transport system component
MIRYRRSLLRIALLSLFGGGLALSPSTPAGLQMTGVVDQTSVFDDLDAFIAATGATSATGPFPRLGAVGGSVTVGSVSFRSGPRAGGLHLGTYSSTIPGEDWTPRLPGSDLAIDAREDLDVEFVAPQRALGFFLVEAERDYNGGTPQLPFVDSLFTVELKLGTDLVGRFEFNRPSDTAAFVGAANALPFDRVEIREVIGDIEDEYFGEFFTGGGESPPACTLNQLTHTTEPNSDSSITNDGRLIAFGSDSDLVGLNPDHNREPYLADRTDGSIVQLARTEGFTGAPVVNGDGRRLVFTAVSDLTGENPDGNPEAFLLDGRGGVEAQITNTVGRRNGMATISSDGRRVVLLSDADLTGRDADGTTEVFLLDVDAGGVQQVTNGGGGALQEGMSVSGDGSRLVFRSDRNLTGDNPDGNVEVFLFDADTSALTQLTRTVGGEQGDNNGPSISADGRWVAFYSDRDPVGENADQSFEAFLLDLLTGSLRQVTHAVTGRSDFVSINGNGTRLALGSSSNLTGVNPDLGGEVFLYDVQAGVLSQLTDTAGSASSDPSISSDGRVIAFESRADLTGGNADRNSEIFHAVCAGPHDVPTADAAGPYSVPEGGAVTLDASGSSDPDGDALAFAWDLDGDGAYETPGTTASFSAAGRDGPSSAVVGLQACDPSGGCDTDDASVAILNLAPTVDAGTDQSVYRNQAVSLAGTFADPAGLLDQPYGWAWAVPGNPSAGTAPYGTTLARTAAFATEGAYTLSLSVTDDDGGTGSDSVVVNVLNHPPDCSAAAPTTAALWPPDHRLVDVGVQGVTDAEADPLTIAITSIRQDEALDARGSGNTAPDAQGVGRATARLRAERAGGGDGRVYHVAFSAADGHGGSCSGVVRVAVPHDHSGRAAVDGGPLHDSTANR